MQWYRHVGERRAVKLWAKAPFQARPAMRTEGFCTQRRANENRHSSIAATIETAWALLSSVAPLRRKNKCEHAVGSMSSCLALPHSSTSGRGHLTAVRAGGRVIDPCRAQV